jgi:hypothetical protein
LDRRKREAQAGEENWTAAVLKYPTGECGGILRFRSGGGLFGMWKTKTFKKSFFLVQTHSKAFCCLALI